MDFQGGFTQSELQQFLDYIYQSLNIKPFSNDDPQVRAKGEARSSLLPTENSFLRNILEEKTKSLRSLLTNVNEQVDKTKSLEGSLLSYLDVNILKVRNHLIEIDFWQNYGLHKDVISLRTQMQQQLFQLEQEKVRTRAQINNQLIQLGRESRSIMKELQDLEIQFRIFK